MENQSTISAYQKIVSKWAFQEPISFPEEFAQKRFQRKMEQPSRDNDKILHKNAWSDFIEHDNQMPDIHLPSGEWYQARALLHSWIRGDSERSPIDFPKGSSVIPTRGLNSIEFRLAGGSWTCTPENFDEFSKLVYNHKALKRAFRKRYTTWFLRSRFKQTFKESERILWKRFGEKPNAGYLIYRWKLAQITTFVRGSRFSTVPKNNQKRRPINIEPFGNLLVQRQIGNFLRKCLKDQGIDLDSLAQLHCERIKDPTVATIDLKNASDSVSMHLVRFMFPIKIVKRLEKSRSFLLFGADGEYHIPKKISSMGNGFTFELMTAILNALCRTLDPKASVFGDDIIITKDCANRLIELLTEVGFTVNLEKSFVDGPFRESCGANYHDEWGYIDSFDFLYPNTIADCALILSKCYALKKYESFSLLYDQLFKRTPAALRGGPLPMVRGLVSWSQPDLTPGFCCDIEYLKDAHHKIASLIQRAFHVSNVKEAIEFVWKPELRTKTTKQLVNRRHWAKYEMYLHAGRACDDVVSGSGQWVIKKVYFINGQLYRFDSKYLRELRSMFSKT